MEPGMVSALSVDTAIERLLQRGAQVSSLVELQLLKAENERLKAQLGAVQAEDDGEIERLWGAIEDLEVQLALARQTGGRQLPSRQELVDAAGAQPSLEELGHQVAALSQQLHVFSDTLGLSQAAVQHQELVDNGPVVPALPAAQCSLAPSELQGQRGGTSVLVLGPELQAQIDSSIRAQLREALPDLCAEIRAVLGGALAAAPAVGTRAGERAAEVQPADNAATRQPVPLPVGPTTVQHAALPQPRLTGEAALGLAAASGEAAPLSVVAVGRPTGAESTQAGGDTTAVPRAAQEHGLGAAQAEELVLSQEPSELLVHMRPAPGESPAAGAGACGEALRHEVGGVQVQVTASAIAASQAGKAADLANRRDEQQPALHPQQAQSAGQEPEPQDGLQTGPPPGWLGSGQRGGNTKANRELAAQEAPGHAAVATPSEGQAVSLQEQQQQKQQQRDPGQQQHRQQRQQAEQQHCRPGSAASGGSGAQSGGRVSFSLGPAKRPASVFDRSPSPALASGHSQQAQQPSQQREEPQLQQPSQQGPQAKRQRVVATTAASVGPAPVGAGIASHAANTVPAAIPAEGTGSPATAVLPAGKSVPGRAASGAPSLAQAATEAVAPKQVSQPDSSRVAKVGSAAAAQAGQAGRRGGQQGEAAGGRPRQPSPSLGLLTSGFMSGAVPSSMTAADLSALPRICPPCGATLPGHGEYLQHLSSSEHWRRLTALCRLVEGLEGDTTLTKEERRAFDKAQAQNWPCFACGKAITSVSGFLKHMEGSKHFATVSSSLRSLAAESGTVPSRAAATAPSVPAADGTTLALAGAVGGPGAGPDQRSAPLAAAPLRQEQQGQAVEGSGQAGPKTQQQQQQQEQRQAQQQQPLRSQPVQQDQQQARKQKYQWHRAQAQPQAQHPQQPLQDQRQGQQHQRQGHQAQPQQQQQQQQQKGKAAQPQEQQKQQQPAKESGSEPARPTQQPAVAAATHAAAPGQKRSAEAAGLASSQDKGGKQKGSSGKSQAKASGEASLGGAAVGGGPAADKAAGGAQKAEAGKAATQGKGKQGGLGGGARPESGTPPPTGIGRHKTGSNTVPLGKRAPSGSQQVPTQQAQQPTAAAGTAAAAAATAAERHAGPGAQQAARANPSNAQPRAPLGSGQPQAPQRGVAAGTSRPSNTGVMMVGPSEGNTQAGGREARGMGSGGGPSAGDEEEVEEGELLLPQHPPGITHPAVVQAPLGPGSSQRAAAQAKPGANSRPAAVKSKAVVKPHKAEPVPVPAAAKQAGPFSCSFCIGAQPFPGLKAYLKHITHITHIRRVEVALQNLQKGNQAKKVLISKQHWCHACNVHLPYREFLSHLLSDEHDEEVRKVLKQVRADAHLASNLRNASQQQGAAARKATRQQGQATVEDESAGDTAVGGGNAGALPRTVVVERRGQGRAGTQAATALGMAAMEQQWPGSQGMMQHGQQGMVDYMAGQAVGQDMLSSQLQGQPGFFAGPMLRPMSLPMMQQLQPASLPMMHQPSQLLPGLGMPLMPQQQLQLMQQQLPPWVQDRMLQGMWPPF